MTDLYTNIPAPADAPPAPPPPPGGTDLERRLSQLESDVKSLKGPDYPPVEMQIIGLPLLMTEEVIDHQLIARGILVAVAHRNDDGSIGHIIGRGRIKQRTPSRDTIRMQMDDGRTERYDVTRYYFLV